MGNGMDMHLAEYCQHVSMVFKIPQHIYCTKFSAFLDYSGIHCKLGEFHKVMSLNR
jgi:hypothetical protein